MSKKLFVGSLSWGTNDEALRQAFEVHGQIEEAVVISDRDTGRSRGFGFVEMGNSEHADQAISELNGHSMDGRQLNVNEARERTSGPRGGGGVQGAREPRRGGPRRPGRTCRGRR